jgi:hypothetical protein
VTYSHYPKLAIVCRTDDHFILAFSSRRGPKPDIGEFKELISVAARRVKLRCIVADAGYDSESNHQFARETLASRSIFPAKHGRPTNKPATGKYRRLMQVRFDQKTYRKRVQVEEIKGVRPLCWALWGNRTRGRPRGLGIIRRFHRRRAVWAWIGSAIKKTTNPIQAPDRSKRPDRFDSI